METPLSSTTRFGPMCSLSSTSRIWKNQRAVLSESMKTLFTSSWRKTRRLKWPCSVHLISLLRQGRSGRTNLIAYSVPISKTMWLVIGLSYSPKGVKIQAAKTVNRSMISHHVLCLKNFSFRSTA
jgi:hypothetical protein